MQYVCKCFKIKVQVYQKRGLLGGEWTRPLFTIHHRNFKLAYIKQSAEGLRHRCLHPGLGRVHRASAKCVQFQGACVCVHMTGAEVSFFKLFRNSFLAHSRKYFQSVVHSYVSAFEKLSQDCELKPDRK